jgi:hypothetical protein
MLALLMLLSIWLWLGVDQAVVTMEAEAVREVC